MFHYIVPSIQRESHRGRRLGRWKIAAGLGATFDRDISIRIIIKRNKIIENEKLSSINRTGGPGRNVPLGLGVVS
jgi:hypothetical protein